MKKFMTVALALTIVGGAAFAQKNTAKQEVKQENKAAEVKTVAKKKKVVAAKKVETTKKVDVAK